MPLPRRISSGVAVRKRIRTNCRYANYYDTGLLPPRGDVLTAGQSTPAKIEAVLPFDRVSPPRNRPAITLAAVLTGIWVLLVYYSQSIAFAWDAGFHLLAAQLINAGKRPYLDFRFPQTPLNVWWMAFWMRVFGQSWRVPQALAALETMGAVALAASFVFRRFPVARWRLAAAVATAVLCSLNELVFRFGTIGQAYGICLFLTVAAFRVAVVTPGRRSLWGAAAAGLLAGAAAGCSLLSAMAAPALLAWIAFHSRQGNRWAEGAAFVAAALFLFCRWPASSSRGRARHGSICSNTRWPTGTRTGAAPRGMTWREMTTWLDSTPGLLLLLLAGAALWFLRRPECGAELRAEFYLCGWLALALGAEVALARPTFARYFVLVVPFLAILAGPGFYEVATRLRGAQSRPLAPTLLLAVLTAMGAGRAIYNNGDNVSLEGFAKGGRQDPPGDAAQRPAVRLGAALFSASPAAARGHAVLILPRPGSARRPVRPTAHRAGA